MAMTSIPMPLRFPPNSLRNAARWLALALPAALLAAVGCTGDATPEATDVVAESDAGVVAEAEAADVVAETEMAQSDWAQARVEAIRSIYDLTPEGERFLAEHDLRRMWGEPGWFGSFGYHGWTGVGESRLGPVMHELGHAYWGAFPVTGRPDLTWPESGGVHDSAAILQYHADVLTFMSQPPDAYEPLRERLRNLPNVQLGDESGLLHFAEADLVHTTGGNPRLLPPILRRYFDAYLADGGFDSWYAALEWWQGLPPREARAAAVYFGLDHLDFDLYRDLKPPESSTSLPEGVAEIVEREERQRLVDFAVQFDAVTGLQEVDGRRVTLELPFLRGYLLDKLALHRRYPDALAGLADSVPAAADLEDVLHAFAELDGLTTSERADALAPRLSEPIFSVFWPMVNPATLMELHARGVAPQDADPAARTTDGEIARLGRIADSAAVIISRARDSLDAGVRDLESLLRSVLAGEGGDVALALELALAADRDLAREIVVRLDHDLVRELLAEEPGMVRQLLPPDMLLPILGVTADADASTLANGIDQLLQATSGNYRSDRPVLSSVYGLVAERGRFSPEEALYVTWRTGLFVEAMLRERPSETVGILASDTERAAALIAETTGYGRTPQGLIHAVIYEEPTLAARLVDAMEAAHPEAARESLVHFAYDSRRKAALPSLRVSPGNDGAFILALAELQGDARVAQSMAEAIAQYRGLTSDGTAPPDFLQAYAATLAEAAIAQPDAEARVRLRRITEEAFALAGEG